MFLFLDKHLMSLYSTSEVVGLSNSLNKASYWNEYSKQVAWGKVKILWHKELWTTQ